MSKKFVSVGFGPGIAFATAQKFAQHGFDIVIASRFPEKHGEAISLMESYGVTVEAVSVDASSAESVSSFIESIGRDLHVLHYNAGAIRLTSAGEIAAETLCNQTNTALASDIQINIVSALVAIREAEKIMSEAQRGTIFLTGGGLAIYPSADYLTLSVGKAGVRAMTQAMFEPLKEKGIHIATVTVCAFLNSDESMSNQIADKFLSLHKQHKDNWTWEDTFSPE